MKDNLARMVEQFNESLAKKGKTRDLSKDLPPRFARKLSDFASQFEREVGSLGHTDPNVRFLGAMGALLLSWSIAISRAKEGDSKRPHMNDEIRALAINTVYWNSKEYLDLVLKQAFDIGPRLNRGKNSPIIQASEGYDPSLSG